MARAVSSTTTGSETGTSGVPQPAEDQAPIGTVGDASAVPLPQRQSARLKFLVCVWIWGLLPGAIGGLLLTYSLWYLVDVEETKKVFPATTTSVNRPDTTSSAGPPASITSPPPVTRPSAQTSQSTPAVTTTNTDPVGCGTSTSNDCLLAKDLFTVSLNNSYDPCEDFFGYVCSTFNEPSGDSLTGMTQYLAETAMAALSGIDVPQRGQSASQKAAGLYRSCVELGTSEKSEVSSLKDFTRKMDVDISSLSVPSTFKVAERLVQLSAEYGLSTYVRIGTNLQQNVKHINVLRYRPDITWMNRTENELARKGTLQGFFESYLRSYDQAIDVRAYQARITAAERNLMTYINNLEIQEEATVPWPTTIRLDKLGDVTKRFITSADWLQMIRKYTGKKFKKSQLVTVWDNGALVMEYMIDSAGIGSADSRLLIGWSLVRRLTHLASGSLMTELYAPKIREFCFQTVRGVMEVAVANVYLEKFISQSTIDKATRMARMVMEQLKTKITQSRWMRGEVLAISKAKAASMGLVMGYSQDFNPLSRITKYYATFPDVNASFLPGYLKAHKAATRHFFAEDDAQNFTVGEANAFYHPGDNTLTLRAGIIQPPLFFTRGVSAMNFGGLGQVVGHEIMHGFDVGKILIDKDGYPATSTDPATLAEYERKVLCLRSAYQAVEQERQFTSIDPTYDSEGFADWAGLELAYSAYRSLPAAERDAAIPGLRLTAEQLFFVTHCFKWCGYTKQRLAGNRYWASRTRCVGPARQLAEFARAFACRPNSRMNPRTRCTFF